MIRPFVLLLALSPLAATAKPKAAPEEFSLQAPEHNRCEALVESFCDFLWAPPRHGNHELRLGKKAWPIRLGNSANDIPLSRLAFLTALERRWANLPPDVRRALERTGFRKELRAYLRRKAPGAIKVSDLSRNEFLQSILGPLRRAILLVSWERTEKDFPGYSKLAVNDIPFEIGRAQGRHQEQAWSELYTAVWRKEASWEQVKKLFEKTRGIHVALLEEDETLSPSLRQFQVESVRSLKLLMPGEAPEKTTDDYWDNCGIDLSNAFYSGYKHEITLCAGEFAAVSPLLTLSHEIGHSYSLGRRLLGHYRANAYGKHMLELWRRSLNSEPLSCEEWPAFKENLVRAVDTLPSYAYEDETRLSGLVTKKLLPLPEGDQLTRLVERLAKSTVRPEIDNHWLDRILKPEETLRSGRKVPNTLYLSAVRNYGRWPTETSALDNAGLQFEMIFAQEYRCNLEKKMESPEAISGGVDEATRLLKRIWDMYLRVPGRFSPYKDAGYEDLAQDIEEDLVDSVASKVVARYLKGFPGVEERRAEYLASLASYCTAPSFIQQYPKDVEALRRYSNKPHTLGQERRRKMLTPEIREALACE